MHEHIHMGTHAQTHTHMTSNTVVAMRDIVQMCFIGFSIQIE